MRDEAVEAVVAVLVMALLVCSNAWSTVTSLEVGRCQSACWLASYTYTSTDATACLCGNAGVPVAVGIPKEPGR